METATARAIHDPAADFYIDAMKKLQDTNIPFLVGGAFAFSHYSQVPRETKDIDVFVIPEGAAVSTLAGEDSRRRLLHGRDLQLRQRRRARRRSVVRARAEDERAWT